MRFLKLLPMLLVIFQFSSSAQKKAFEITDLYKLKSLSGPAVNSSGSQLLFSVTRYKLEEGTSKTGLSILDLNTKKSRELTNSESVDFSPFWDKDENGFYFISSRAGSYQVFYMPMNGGEPKQITDYFTNVSDPKLSPDGNYIVFSASVFPECEGDENCNLKIRNGLDNGPVQAYIADSLFLRHWTEYNDGSFTHIIVYDISNDSYKDITPGYWNSPAFSAGGGGEYDISPDSKEVVFTSKRVKNPASSTNVDLFTVNIDGTGLKNITSENKAMDNNPAYSPDGKYIAYLSQKIPGYESDKIRLTLYNRETGLSEVVSESFDNWVNEFVWGSDSEEIFFSGYQRGYLPVFKYNLNSKKITQISGNTVALSLSIDKENNLYFLSSSVGSPYEIYSLSTKTGKTEKITDINSGVTEKTDIRPAEQMWVKGSDGTPIQVFIVKPHDFDPAKKYPLILNVHGGPQYQWMDSFRADWQVYPGSGYIVAFPNPHGSTGYGQDFTAEISGDWGGKVYEDLMLVTDSLETLPYVDTSRIGAMGWSFGGYMMNWFQAKTHRFKCMVSMMGLYDLNTFWGVTEELWFPEWDLKGQPWNSEKYRKFSPSNYTDNFKTPTLIITGERDYRVPYTQSIYYFTTLQKLGIDSRLIIFKNDGHWPSHIKSMPVYYNSHLEWFNKYLGGEKAPYDTKKLIKNIEFQDVN